MLAGDSVKGLADTVAMMKELDGNGDGMIDFQVFMEMMKNASK